MSKPFSGWNGFVTKVLKYADKIPDIRVTTIIFYLILPDENKLPYNQSIIVNDTHYSIFFFLFTIVRYFEIRCAFSS